MTTTLIQTDLFEVKSIKTSLVGRRLLHNKENIKF